MPNNPDVPSGPNMPSSRPTPPLASGGGAEGPLQDYDSIHDRYSSMFLEGLLQRMSATEQLMFIYILSSRSGTLYTGVTNDLCQRVPEHKKKINRGFSSQYDCTKLVYFEICDTPGEAIEREKQIKRWRREKKERLIRSLNPPWIDLSQFLPKIEASRLDEGGPSAPGRRTALRSGYPLKGGVKFRSS